MAITAGLALALVAFAAGSKGPVHRPAPPVVIHVTTAPNVSRSVVQAARAEADAIFRGTGVTFLWLDGEGAPASLHVVVGNEQGPSREAGTPLGWLVFENDTPTETLYLSYANAERYLKDSREVVGVLNNKTLAEKEMLLGRLIGRALAHELGHYLIGTKEHTARGLLKGAPTASEFFSTNRSPFAIDAAERTQIAARLFAPPVLARREDVNRH